MHLHLSSWFHGTLIAIGFLQMAIKQWPTWVTDRGKLPSPDSKGEVKCAVGVAGAHCTRHIVLQAVKDLDDAGNYVVNTIER